MPSGKQHLWLSLNLQREHHHSAEIKNITLHTLSKYIYRNYALSFNYFLMK